MNDVRTYRVDHDAAGYHVTYMRNGSFSGNSYNHATREEAVAVAEQAMNQYRNHQ